MVTFSNRRGDSLEETLVLGKIEGRRGRGWKRRRRRGWDSWLASPTQWTWVWASSGSWWWTGKPGMLQSMVVQRVRHDWVTELNWTELANRTICCSKGPWILKCNRWGGGPSPRARACSNMGGVRDRPLGGFITNTLSERKLRWLLNSTSSPLKVNFCCKHGRLEVYSHTRYVPKETVSLFSHLLKYRIFPSIRHWLDTLPIVTCKLAPN